MICSGIRAQSSAVLVVTAAFLTAPEFRRERIASWHYGRVSPFGFAPEGPFRPPCFNLLEQIVACSSIWFPSRAQLSENTSLGRRFFVHMAYFCTEWQTVRAETSVNASRDITESRSFENHVAPGGPTLATFCGATCYLDDSRCLSGNLLSALIMTRKRTPPKLSQIDLEREPETSGTQLRQAATIQQPDTPVRKKNDRPGSQRRR